MIASQQPAQPVTAPASPFQSFADMVDYSKLYADLEKRGIILTDEEKKLCEKICGDRLRNHDGGQVIGNSFGGTIQGLVYTLFAVLKNLFGGISGGGSLGDIMSNLGSTLSSSNEQSKLYQLQLAESETYIRLKQAGGNLAAAAEYITGMKPSSDKSASKDMPFSILNQVGRYINLPVDSNTSLNLQPQAVASASAPTGLPPKVSTQALTGRD